MGKIAVGRENSDDIEIYYELARSLLVVGRVERRRKARRQSRQALRRARELAAEMGYRPLLAQIKQEMPHMAAVRSDSDLTATERRVADLIATGATNRTSRARCSSACGPPRRTSPPSTASWACAAGPSWPGVWPDLSSPTDTAPRRRAPGPRISVATADLPQVFDP
jgi:hypothetical protein